MISDAVLLATARQLKDPSVEHLTEVLQSIYHQGLEEGTTKDALYMYWLGVQTGIERCAWVDGPTGEKYVGPIRSNDSRLSVKLKQAQREMQEAMEKRGS